MEKELIYKCRECFIVFGFNQAIVHRVNENHFHLQRLTDPNKDATLKGQGDRKRPPDQFGPARPVSRP